ncbi:murein DD-endopeptidase MepM/ murein hydrolase activator NlpD [Actinoplanes tereljensis]|nr:peptidoglycan DD-metalloendopeptidase family protein [Actinoplanes tereljensis]
MPLILLVSILLAPLFGWPIDSAPVVRRFDPPPQRWLPGHRGVDLAAPPGAAVRAAGAGTVVFVGIIAGNGVVSVSHAGGLRTTYQPVLAQVTRGEQVAAGGELGLLEAGHPGCPSAACLHWGLRRGDAYLDPLALLGLGRVRLLPLSAGN